MKSNRFAHQNFTLAVVDKQIDELLKLSRIENEQDLILALLSRFEPVRSAPI